MNYYGLLKYFLRIRSRRVKLFGLYVAHSMGRRYVGMFLDPVMSCNLRCQMCAFSSDEARPQPVRPMPISDVEALQRAIFHRVMKLQIGCGAEPTLYSRLADLIKKAKRSGIPYVSMTTNGQLLTTERLQELATAGLDELTISTHGLQKSTYEELMRGASFDRFKGLLADMTELKRHGEPIKLRINYTINRDNYRDLYHLDDFLGQYSADIVQIRPIQDLGDSVYRDFDLSEILAHYDELFPPIIDYCRAHGITLLYPEPNNLEKLEEPSEQYDMTVQDFSYCYCYPETCLNEDFHFRDETYEQYCRRTHRGRQILNAIFGGAHKGKEKTVALNYKVK